MKEIKEGDIVTHKLHKKEDLFKVVNLSKSNKQSVLLKGLNLRLYVTALADELELADSSNIKAGWKDIMMKKAGDKIKAILDKRTEVNC